MAKSPHSLFSYGVLSFLAGALLLGLLSIPQKMALGADAFAIEGFIVPVFFGGAMGTLLGLAYWRVHQENLALKQAHDEAIQRDLHYISYFEKNKSPMLLIDPATARIVDANPAACDFYGYSKAAITRMNISDINTMPPDEIMREMKLAKSQERHYFNFKHRLADGEIRDVEVHSGPIQFSDSEMLYSVIQDVTRRKQTEAERERLISQLQDALAEIKTLSGLLPICSSCKKIRDDKGYWKRIEEYIGEHSNAQFSHGICPECLERLYPELSKDEQEQSN
jgi:PAS domain S-box-containing protein